MHGPEAELSSHYQKLRASGWRRHGGNTSVWCTIPELSSTSGTAAGKIYTGPSVVPRGLDRPQSQMQTDSGGLQCSMCHVCCFAQVLDPVPVRVSPPSPCRCKYVASPCCYGRSLSQFLSNAHVGRAWAAEAQLLVGFK